MEPMVYENLTGIQQWGGTGFVFCKFIGLKTKAETEEWLAKQRPVAMLIVEEKGLVAHGTDKYSDLDPKSKLYNKKVKGDKNYCFNPINSMYSEDLKKDSPRAFKILRERDDLDSILIIENYKVIDMM